MTCVALHDYGSGQLLYTTGTGSSVTQNGAQQFKMKSFTFWKKKTFETISLEVRTINGAKFLSCLNSEIKIQRKHIFPSID